MNKLYRVMRISGVLLALISLSLLSLQLRAQTTYGAIVGTITDQTGSVIPNATVTVVNVGTNETRIAKVDGAGNFSAANLQPATYRVTVQAGNFKRFVRDTVPVAVGATVRIDATLEVGAATETVEVTTAPPLLQTDSSSLSQEIEGATVQEMPLNGRNTMNLIALAPGVIPGGSTSGSPGGNQGAGHTNVVGFGNYQIGGNLPGASATYVDGGPVNLLGGNLGGNVTSFIPTQDAVQEFNVASNNVSAEFGRFGGGVINMASKGGTNSIHGSAYEYIRNAFFNANEWFNKRTELVQGRPNKPVHFNQNQYGVSVGGPIRKDKLFYQFTWEGFHSNTGVVAPTNVPTTAMQNGVFNHAITDPLNRCTIVNNPAAGTWTITNLFTGGCGDPLAKVIRAYYPAPNVPGVAVGANNFYAVPATPDTQDQYNGRVDYVASSKQRIFARYSYWKIQDAGYNELGNAGGFLTQNASSANFTQQFVLGDTYAFSPRTLLDVRAIYLRDYSPNSQVASSGLDFGAAGFAGTYLTNLAAQMTAHIIPQYTFSGGNYNFYSFARCCTVGTDWYNNYSLSASVTRIQGNHSFKFGGLGTKFTDISIAGGNSGMFTYNGQYTGDQWADFLLGYETNGSTITTQNEAYAYNYYQGYYATDTWQLSHRLTLNLGIRWEFPGGIYAGHDNSTVLLPNTIDPTYNVPGTVGLVNSSLYPHSSAMIVKYDLFAPRVGFAYRAGEKAVVSGGYGISYLPIDVSTGALPVKSAINSNPTSCGTVNTKVPDPTQLMYNCFSAANPIIAPPERSAGYFAALKYYNNTSKAITAPYPYQKYPYTQQWNLSVAQELPSSSMVQMSYVGSAAVHLPALSGNLNQLPDQYDSLGSGLLASGSCGFSVGQCLRPYPHYGNIRDSLSYTTQTIYHSLQVKGEKHFGGGGVLLGNITWAKIIGDTDSTISFLEAGTAGPNTGGGGAGAYQDYTNLRAERSVLTYDVPVRAVLSYVLTLPFGHGQRFGNDVGGALNRIISGWGLNGITTFQHGFRVPVKDTAITSGVNQNNQLSSTFGAGTLRPNYMAGCIKSSPRSGNDRINQWFNTSCFTQPAPYTFGNEPRVDTSIFAQGIDNFDFSALKSTPITERVNLQFRAEFFNVFNRKQFAQPDSSLGSVTFGQVLGTDNQPRLVQFSARATF